MTRGTIAATREITRTKRDHTEKKLEEEVRQMKCSKKERIQC